MLTNHAGGTSPLSSPSEKRVGDNDVPRILVLAPRFPYPAIGGDRLFVLNVAKALRPYRLTLLTFCSTREEMQREPQDGTFSEIHRVFLPRWRSIASVIPQLLRREPLQLAYYRSEAFQAKVNELIPRHHAVVAHLIRTGQYLAGTKSEIPKVLLMADAISLTYSRMTQLGGTSPLWRFLYRAELERLFPYERDCARHFDQAWLHSEIDREFLGLNPAGVRIVPMGMDLTDFPFNPHASGDVIAFIGNMASSMNRDACSHFVRDILPLLRERANLRFRIIGACPPALRRRFERHPGVEVTGMVPRIVDAVQGAFCGVCPVRGGAGIQNKVLNYMALGLPCVTSPIGHEGIPATDGRDLFVYRDCEEAVNAILRLRDDVELRRRVAASARTLVESGFDWTPIHRRMRHEIFQLMKDRRVRAA